MLKDQFNRKISYLRVSVTDRCDLRCLYCMEENMVFLPKKEVLSLEELYKLCSTFIDLGVKKIRLTGGEPLVRKNVISLITNLGKHIKPGELDELTLTTNGMHLKKYSDQLFKSGIKRINVSLDTLNHLKYHKITRWGNLDKVISGIMAAKSEGLKIKINTVALRNFNDYEFDNLIEWCGKHNFDITFIETMPMGEVQQDRNKSFLPLNMLRASLEKSWTFKDIKYETSGPARYLYCNEAGINVGFISPLSHNFCSTCNRVRLTCTGKLYMCLGQDDFVDLGEIVRTSNNYEKVNDLIYQAMLTKPKEHDFIINKKHLKPSVKRHMSVTGG